MIDGGIMARVWFNKTFSNVRAVLELIRQGDTAGEFRLLCTHPSETFPGFLAADECDLEPADLAGNDYVEFCLDFCRKQRVDLFWPGKGAALLAAHRDRFLSQGIRLLTVATADTLAILQDKARFYAEARRFSIPPPDTLEFRSEAEFETTYTRLRGVHDVLCFKPSDGVNGSGFRVIEERRGALDILLRGTLYAIDLAGFRRILADTKNFPPLLLMEYLDGPEYSVDCVGDGRKLIAHVQRKKPESGVYGQCIVGLPELERAISEMVEAYALRGLFNVQFREGRSGLRLLEINPRFAGGIGMSGAAGVNLPYLALKGAVHGFSDCARTPARVGARVMEISRACQVMEQA